MANGDGTQTAQAAPMPQPPPPVPDHLGDLRIRSLDTDELQQRTLAQARAALPQPQTSEERAANFADWQKTQQEQWAKEHPILPPTSRLGQAYAHLKNIISTHEGQVSERYLKPFRESLDRMGQDLVAAGESGHTKTGRQLTTPARLMTLGVGHLLSMVPVGHDVQSTIAANVVPPEFGPEGKALSKELRAGAKAEKTAANLTHGYIMPSGRFEPLDVAVNENHSGASLRLFGEGKASPEQHALDKGAIQVHVRDYLPGKPTEVSFQAKADTPQNRARIGQALQRVPEGTKNVTVAFQNPDSFQELSFADALNQFPTKPNLEGVRQKSAAVTETGWLTKSGTFEPLKTGEGHYDAANRLGLDVKDPKGAQPTYDALNAGHIRIYRHQKANASHFEAESINDQSRGLISKALNDSSFPEGHSVQLEFHKPKYTLKEFDSPDQAKEWLENLGTRTEQQQLPPQPRLPDTGTHAAIKTDDGSIYYDDAPEKQRTHIMLAKDLGIPPKRVVSGGWLQDGHYEASERSDAGRWAEQARAKAAVAEKRAVRAQSELPAPTTTTAEAKAKERAANLRGLGIGLTEMNAEDAKNWVGYTNQKSIKVFRGVDDPSHKIEAGDFVTTSRESAQNYGKHVQELEVSPSELRYVRGHKDGAPKLLDQGGQTELIYSGAGKAQTTATDDQILNHFDKKYPAAKETVDGHTVREDVPNLDSISASLAPNYEVLDGVREIPMSHFDDPGTVTPRTKQLAADIKQSGELNPLIVGIDHRGPYILEGGHRFDALRINNAKSFPAIVALDLNKGFRPNVEEELGKDLEAKTETLYHGSPDVSKIDQLKPGSKGGYFGDGIYLTHDPNVARRFTKLEAMNPTLERNADGSFTDINTGKRIPGGKPGVIETTLKDARLKKITMDEMDAEIEKFRKPNGVIDLDGARNAIAQRFAKQGYDGFDVAKSKYFDEPQVVIFPSSAHKLSINKPEVKSLHTIEGAQPLADRLGAKVVGSVATGKTSADPYGINRGPKDLDLRIDGEYKPDEIQSKLKAEGYEFRGSSVLSPQEQKASGKNYGKPGWKRAEHFENSAGQKIDVWHDETGPVVFRNGRRVDVPPAKKLK